MWEFDTMIFIKEAAWSTALIYLGMRIERHVTKEKSKKTDRPWYDEEPPRGR